MAILAPEFVGFELRSSWHQPTRALELKIWSSAGCHVVVQILYYHGKGCQRAWSRQ